jgi:hypothetical protein
VGVTGTGAWVVCVAAGVLVGGVVAGDAEGELAVGEVAAAGVDAAAAGLATPKPRVPFRLSSATPAMRRNRIRQPRQASTMARAFFSRLAPGCQLCDRSDGGVQRSGRGCWSRGSREYCDTRIPSFPSAPGASER